VYQKRQSCTYLSAIGGDLSTKLEVNLFILELVFGNYFPSIVDYLFSSSRVEVDLWAPM
jgi:hypothetical protein